MLIATSHSHFHSQFSIEASPAYMIRRSSLVALQELLPHAKLIVCLRDPVERLKSQ